MTTAIIGHLPSLEWSPPTQGWSPMDPRLFDIATLGLHLGLSAKLKIWQVPTCKMEPQSTNSINYCHTRLHLGFSAKLRIWQVPTCKMEPQSGIIIWQNHLTPSPTHTAKLFLWILCGVPTLVWISIEVYYRLGSWHLDLTHKTKTRWQLPWMVTCHP